MADKDMKWKCGAHGYAGEGRNLAKPDGGSAMEVFCEGKVNIKHYKDGNRFRKNC